MLTWTAAELVQAGGIIVSFAVVIDRLLTLFRNWSGSPELKLIKGQLVESNQDVRDLLQRIITRLDRL